MLWSEGKEHHFTSSVCLFFLTPLFSTKVEKNDEDQKIEQDGIKPEDKAHKAATKIQASFRGHITRKKLKGEKKGDAQAAEAEANEKDEAPAADGAEKKEGEGPTPTDAAPASGPKPEETGKAGETPSEEKKGEGAPDAATEQAAPQAPAPSEEKAGSAETESATQASTDNSPSSKAEDAPAKEDPKQADVPAAVTAAAAATAPAAEDAAAKATAQPPTDAVESSQAEEKIGEPPRGSRAAGGWATRADGGDGKSLEGFSRKSGEAALNSPKWRRRGLTLATYIPPYLQAWERTRAGLCSSQYWRGLAIVLLIEFA